MSVDLTLLRVRAYQTSRRALRRSAQFAQAVHDGLWLGALDREHLERLDEVFYARAEESDPSGRSVTYADPRWVRRGLFEWEQALVTEHFPAGGCVLVTGAGSGREVLALLGASWDAWGFEPNGMLAAAGSAVLEADGHAGRLTTMERSRFPQTKRVPDAVLVGWGSYTLMPGRATRVSFLRSARSAIRPGGVVVVSFWLRTGEFRMQRATRYVASTVRRLRGRPPVEPGDMIAAGNFTHRFTRQELEAELRAAGLEPIGFGSAPFGWAVGRA